MAAKLSFFRLVWGTSPTALGRISRFGRSITVDNEGV